MNKILTRGRKNKQNICISVDTLGGDNGESVIVEGLELVRRQYTHVSYLLHGNSKKLDQLLTNYPELKRLSTIVHSSQAVLMTQKPTDALRNGKDTSMFSCIDSVQSRQANAAVSCGNTGALMLMSLVKLRKFLG